MYLVFSAVLSCAKKDKLLGVNGLRLSGAWQLGAYVDAPYSHFAREQA